MNISAGRTVKVLKPVEKLNVGRTYRVFSVEGVWVNLISGTHIVKVNRASFDSGKIQVVSY